MNSNWILVSAFPFSCWRTIRDKAYTLTDAAAGVNFISEFNKEQVSLQQEIDLLKLGLVRE
jgi:hypothetical protein